MLWTFLSSSKDALLICLNSIRTSKVLALRGSVSSRWWVKGTAVIREGLGMKAEAWDHYWGGCAQIYADHFEVRGLYPLMVGSRGDWFIKEICWHCLSTDEQQQSCNT